MRRMGLFLLTGVLMVSLEFAASASEKEKKRQAVSGTIDLEPGSKAGGNVYLIVVPAGKDLFKVEEPDKKNGSERNAQIVINPNEASPSSHIQFVKIGYSSDRSHAFSVNLSPGSYQFGCMIKYSRLPCDSTPINENDKVLSCIPLQEDILCPLMTITVQDETRSGIQLKAGIP